MITLIALLLSLQAAAEPSQSPADAEAIHRMVETNRIPSAEIVSRLEEAIKLPVGAQPLDWYTRIYTQSELNGKDSMVATFIPAELAKSYYSTRGLPVSPVMLVKINDMPPVADGGCNVIQFVWPLDNSAPLTLACNRVAAPSPPVKRPPRRPAHSPG